MQLELGLTQNLKLPGICFLDWCHVKFPDSWLNQFYAPYSPPPHLNQSGIQGKESHAPYWAYFPNCTNSKATSYRLCFGGSQTVWKYSDTLCPKCRASCKHDKHWMKETTPAPRHLRTPFAELSKGDCFQPWATESSSKSIEPEVHSTSGKGDRGMGRKRSWIMNGFT